MEKKCWGHCAQKFFCCSLEEDHIVWQSVDLDGPYAMYTFDKENSAFLFASDGSENGYGDNVLVYMDMDSQTPVWYKELDYLRSFVAGDVLGLGSRVVTLESSILNFYTAR